MKKLLILPFIIIHLFAATYTSTEAKSHIGDFAAICGKVYQVYFTRKGHIFLNIDGRYPNNKAAFVIWKKYKNSFDLKKIESLENKNICAEGIIREYRGKPEIFLKESSQIKIGK